MYSAADLKKSKSNDKQTGYSQHITIQQNRNLMFSKIHMTYMVQDDDLKKIKQNIRAIECWMR